jgi:hypothetical protein
MGIGEIFAVLKALPKLIDLLKGLSGAIAKIDLDRDIREIQEAHDQLDKAQTFKDRMAAYRRIAELGKRL